MIFSFSKNFEKNLPVIKIDKSLDQYKGKVIFEKLLEEANRMLKIAGVPKSAKKHS